MRHGEVAVDSPFRYSVIIWAIIAGILVFGEHPGQASLIGTAIVFAAGVYMFMRESSLRRQRQQATKAP